MENNTESANVGEPTQEVLVKSEEKTDNNETKGKTAPVRKTISRATIRRRNNALVKKAVAPKAPVQVLNEILGPGNISYRVQSRPDPLIGQKVFTAQLSLEGRTFVADGPNRTIAKNIVAEEAIHHIVVKRNNERTEEDGKNQDNTPWGALASLALYKLFNDWQSNGYSLPPTLKSNVFESKEAIFNGELAGSEHLFGNLGYGNMEQSSYQGRSYDFTDEAGTFHTFSPECQRHEQQQMYDSWGFAVPNNVSQGQFSQKHPVSLLNEKRGKGNPITYSCSEEGDLPNKVFSMTCTVDGASFTGEAKSKKEAKQIAAIKALSEVYGIQY